MKQHQKKYYGSLVAILLLIVATATKNVQIPLCESVNEFVHFLNDLAGMAVIPQ